MSNDKMREAFEEKYPPPEGVFWSGDLGYYTTKSAEYILEMDGYNEFFDVWQAALTQQPESEPVDIDYLVTVFESAACRQTYKMVDGVKAVAEAVLKRSPQPSAQVPDKKELKDTPREYFQTDSELYVYTAGWNDCRDSMLAPSIEEEDQ